MCFQASLCPGYVAMLADLCGRSPSPSQPAALGDWLHLLISSRLGWPGFLAEKTEGYLAQQLPHQADGHRHARMLLHSGNSLHEDCWDHGGR
mmetsp:Transcript_20950/g.46149  ORF Transcript_20950/g.46149 Transcript_20950/m.46149 type:complete len:92 (-) Transcript_20950:87-362(-)